MSSNPSSATENAGPPGSPGASGTPGASGSPGVSKSAEPPETIEAIESAIAAGSAGASGSEGPSGSSRGKGKRPPRDSTPGPGRSSAATDARQRRGRSRSRSRSPRRRGEKGEKRADPPRDKVHRDDIPRERGHRRDRAAQEAVPKPNENYKFSHILIKHKASRRPFDQYNKPIRRTKDEAMDFVCEIHERILKDLITFADAANSYSDCTSAKYEGDIEAQFQSGKMLISFKNTAMALGPGQVSNVVESQAGYHILQRRE